MIEVRFRHRFEGGPGRASLDIAFTAPSAGITVLFGPSGAGKSSVIAAIAGLLRPREALVAVDGVTLCDSARQVWIPLERRRVGLVFQEARLFPHLSVRGNLLYGARRAPHGQRPGRSGLEQVAALLGLANLLDRRPHTLSGGERQRVAIGRALLAQPRMLLMDEPLASLDPDRRAAIMPFLVALRRGLALPIVYVTHREDEVATLADTVVLLADGRVRACGPVADLSARGLPGYAQTRAAGAVLDAVVQRHDAGRGLTELRLGTAGRLVLPLRPEAEGSALRLRVPADDLVLAAGEPGETSAQNRLRATVRALHPSGPGEVLVELALPDFHLLARVTTDAAARLGLAPNAPIVALLKSTSIEVLGT